MDIHRTELQLVERSFGKAGELHSSKMFSSQQETEFLIRFPTSINICMAAAAYLLQLPNKWL